MKLNFTMLPSLESDTGRQRRRKAAPKTNGQTMKPDLLHLLHHEQDKVLRRKPSTDGGVTPVTPVTPKKHINEIEHETSEEQGAIIECDARSPQEIGTPSTSNTRITHVHVQGLKPKSLADNEESLIRAWLAHIEETDPETIRIVLDQCADDAGAKQYFLKRAEEVPKPPLSFDDRRTCSECAHLVRGICLAARRGEIQGGGRYMPVPDLLRRCEGFRERKEDEGLVTKMPYQGRS